MDFKIVWKVLNIIIITSSHQCNFMPKIAYSVIQMARFELLNL
jgi:hypothetical protein